MSIWIINLAQSPVDVCDPEVSAGSMPLAENRVRIASHGSGLRNRQSFRRNLEAIAAINKERQISSIFIGQVWNRTKLQSKERYGFLPLVRDMDVWPLQDHFNAIVKATADSLGVPSFIPPIDEFQDDDFVDRGHFSAKGAAKFAVMIMPIIKSSCK